MARPERLPSGRAELQESDRLFVQCGGGPCTSRLASMPVPLEIKDRGGIYVLDDDGDQDDWRYLWVPD